MRTPPVPAVSVTTAPLIAILAGAQPVCPRVEDRDAHRLAGRHIGLETAALAEELYAVVGQRGADHAGGRHEGGGQRRRGITQRDGFELRHRCDSVTIASAGRSGSCWMRSAGAPLAISAAFVASTIVGPAADQDLPVAPAAVSASPPRAACRSGARAGRGAAARRDSRRPTADRCVYSDTGVTDSHGLVRRDLPQRPQVVQLARDSGRRRTGAPAGSRPQRVRSMISVRSGARPVLPATISTSPPSRSICMAPCGLDSRHRSPGLVSPTIAVLTMPPVTERMWNSMRAAAVGGDRRAQVAPPPRPLRHLDGDVLAGVVEQRPVELQPDHRDVAGRPDVLDHRAVAERRALLGVGGAAHHADDQVDRVAGRLGEPVVPLLDRDGCAAWCTSASCMLS